jgi:putative phosphonate metabolism protein
MDEFKRFAIYFAPDPGPLSHAAASWLGWDPALAAPVRQPDVAGLARPFADLTADPRKYGFHATLKAPFRLAQDRSPAALSQACADLARTLQPVILPGLHIISLDGFLAFVPETHSPALGDLAAKVVEQLDPYRARLTQAEIDRRAPHRLTPRQRELLSTYGYPYVIEEFQFHMTLTGRLAPDETLPLRAAAERHFGTLVPRPFPIAAICLFGESQGGEFHLLHRYPLSR